MSLEINHKPSFIASIFPKRERKPKDTLANGEEVDLRPGISIPDYIRKIYNTTFIESFRAYFGFLDRDNKVRVYEPQSEDPMVFRGPESIKEFKEHGHEIIKLMTARWAALGLPITQDKDRGIDIPDTESVVEAILDDPNGKLAKLFNSVREEATLIGSNMDIFKKAALVRTVLPGWWIVSYRGKNAPHPEHFSESMKIILESLAEIRASGIFKEKLKTTIDELGDPLDTNVGFPLYSAEIDKNNTPVSKLMVLSMYAKIGDQGYNFKEVVRKIQTQTPDPVLKRFPFAIACIRRQQPGYKWQHVWEPTMKGLMLKEDQRGHTSNRVAFMAAYILNLYLSPVQAEWKTFRKLIPGLFHDGAARVQTLGYIRKNNPLLFESDFSNYDRTIPNNIMSAFMKGYANMTNHPNYYFDLLSQTHRNLSMIWPDWYPDERGRGWIFKVDELALLSGLKVTSEIGTFMNLIIIVQSMLDSGMMNASRIRQYLTSGIRGKMEDPIVLIQSDDTMFIGKDQEILVKLTKSFIDNSKAAGIKGALELGDRFLMRHMTHGSDKPLLSRIWQNTLSNEASYDDPLKFAVGLAARTDGVLGQKTVDPFGTGTSLGITFTELKITEAVINSIHHFLSTARIPNEEAIKFVEILILASKNMIKRGNLYYMRSSDSHSLNQKRKLFVNALAVRELKNMDAKGGLAKSFLSDLHKNAMSPTTGQILDEIVKLSSQASEFINQLSDKEHQFYLFAMKSLGLNIHVD